MEEKARENISRVLGLVALDLDVSTHCSISLAIKSFTSSTATWGESHCLLTFVSTSVLEMFSPRTQLTEGRVKLPIEGEQTKNSKIISPDAASPETAYSQMSDAPTDWMQPENVF